MGLPTKEKPDVSQGTLALMVLKTLDVLGPQHGYGIARRIEQISGDVLAVNQGTLYPLLLKLENEGSLPPEGALKTTAAPASYCLTVSGRKQLRPRPVNGNRPRLSSRASLKSKQRTCHGISSSLLHETVELRGWAGCR